MNRNNEGNLPAKLEITLDTLIHPKLMPIICSLSRTNEQHRFCSESILLMTKIRGLDRCMLLGSWETDFKLLGLDLRFEIREVLARFEGNRSGIWKEGVGVVLGCDFGGERSRRRHRKAVGNGGGWSLGFG